MMELEVRTCMFSAKGNTGTFKLLEINFLFNIFDF